MKRQTTYIRLSETIAVCKTVSSACAIMITLAAVLSLTGCVKDELHHTPHPDKGALVITADWSGRSDDAWQPERYIIKVDGQPYEVSELYTAPAASAGSSRAAFSPVLPALFTPGIHSLLVYNEPKGFIIDGNIATVGTLENGTLNAEPDYLFSAAETVDISKDDTLRITVPMRQRIRRLKLQLTIATEDVQRIAVMEATLTGIASSIDLSTGSITSTEGRTVVPAWTEQAPDADGDPVLATTMRLLGVVPTERQLLTLDVKLKNGDRHSATDDLTEQLRNFSTGGNMETLTLTSSLRLPIEAGFTGSIEDWTVVDNGDIGIH